MGYIKVVQREDGLQAAMAGFMSRQLTQPEGKIILETHCGSRVSNLYADYQPSRGIRQKSCWRQLCGKILTFPFLLNHHYLDCEGPGALILAIRITEVVHHLSPGTSGEEKLKDRFEDGDKERNETAVQGILELDTIETDSLFEGIDYSCSLFRSMLRGACMDYMRGDLQQRGDLQLETDWALAIPWASREVPARQK